jgi:hypothetical protein
VKTSGAEPVAAVNVYLLALGSYCVQYDIPTGAEVILVGKGSE